MFVNHWHVAPEGVFDKSNPKKGTLEEVRATMRELGIEKAVAFAPFLHCMPEDSWYNIPLENERACNEWLLNSLVDYPEIKAFVTVNPGNSDACDILSEYIGQDFKGVKVHPPVFQARIDDEVHSDFYSLIEDLKAPVLFHTGSHGWEPEQYRPRLIGNLAARHPQLKIIIEHTGGVDYFNEALEVLKYNENCWAGVTSTFIKCLRPGRINTSYLTPERFLEIIRTIGSERIIYGADYPFNSALNTAWEIEFIKSMEISDAEKEHILGGALEKLLNDQA